jgi:post-segregation antitoxin (ccd killing protein)
MKLSGEIELDQEVRTTKYKDETSEASFALRFSAALDAKLEVALTLKVDGDSLQELRELLQLSKNRHKIEIELSPSKQTTLQNFSVQEEIRKSEEEARKKEKKRGQAKASKKIDDLGFLGDKDKKLEGEDEDSEEPEE